MDRNLGCSVRYGSLLVDANPLTDFAQWKVMANNPNSGKKKIKPRWFPKLLKNCFGRLFSLV